MKLPLRLVLPAALLAAFTARAQEPIKFGKPEPQDFTAAPFAGDSAAAAVVLCDYGTTRFQLNGSSFQLMTDRVTRIKILRKAGYDEATVRVPLYHRGTDEEKISGLRGNTYNLVNGQVVKTKLDAGTTFTENRTPNVRVRKFTLPDVREGAVIEYAYTVTSDFLFNFQDWTFQRDIPVRWSEYRAAIPEYFDYKMLMQGYHALAVRTRDENTTQYTLHTGGGSDPTASAYDPKEGRTAASTDVISARVTNYRWAMKDVPAFRDEPYMTTSDDYVDRIDFELAGTHMPGAAYNNVAGTWAKMDSELLADDNFGLQMDRGGFLKEQLAGLPAKYPEVAARAAAVRAIVLAAVRYDGTDRYNTTAPLRKAFDAHRGTAADVNLLLIAALRGAGVVAHPLLLSTRDNGRVNQTLPLLERFNYVVALVPLPDGKDLLVDATEPLLPCGVLPERCLSQTGRLIMKKEAEGRWVDLAPSQRRIHYQQVALALDAQGGLRGKVHEEHGGYDGASARRELGLLGEKKYLTELLRPHSGWSVPALAVSNREDVAKPLALDYEFSQPADDATEGATLYLSPLTHFSTEQNPFRHGERLFPVDFGSAQDKTLMVTLTLPAGYELAELPKPAIIDLPDNGGRYLYSVAAPVPGTVQLTSRLSLRKPVYAAEEYTHLREFYRLMLEKQAEKLVIKKKA